MGNSKLTKAKEITAMEDKKMRELNLDEMVKVSGGGDIPL